MLPRMTVIIAELSGERDVGKMLALLYDGPGHVIIVGACVFPCRISLLTLLCDKSVTFYVELRVSPGPHRNVPPRWDTASIWGTFLSCGSYFSFVIAPL